MTISLSFLPVHLRAATVAVLLAAGGLCGVAGFAAHLERRWVGQFASETSHLKNQGAVLQQAAFVEPGVLPLYGSSELLKRIPDKASLFFAQYPTDFAVSPTGKAGCTSLITLQKIAASANSTPHRKVAVILSPSWFQVPEAHAKGYAGNFSRLQASRLIFNSPLSFNLKHGIAQRLMAYPQTLHRTPILRFAVEHLARGHFTDRVLVALMRPLGMMNNAVFALQDHYESGMTILHEHRHATAEPRKPEAIPWDAVVAQESKGVKVDVGTRPDSRPRMFASSAAFRKTVEGAREWEDVELLLRTLKELRLDPLILSIPMELRHFEEMGISRENVEFYGQRLRSLADHYKVPIVDFADHQEDGRFFADHHDHLSAKGWIFMDRALDEFYHAPRRRAHRHRPAPPVPSGNETYPG